MVRATIITDDPQQVPGKLIHFDDESLISSTPIQF
jgi:hypothetical protein